MVFANFSEEDKQAFFELLDEYFESRPHLFGGTKPKSAPPPVMPRQPPQEQVVALYDYNGVSGSISITYISNRHTSLVKISRLGLEIGCR